MARHWAAGTTAGGSSHATSAQSREPPELRGGERTDGAKNGDIYREERSPQYRLYVKEPNRLRCEEKAYDGLAQIL